ncbi:MAG TPA: tetratricopeptide repeat protein [Polyangiaceae bacterium]|nr:tetratricopeptide repeat protein [Polyangiaceae bacterium]
MQRFDRVLTLSSGLACAALMLGAPRAWADPTPPPAADVALSERYAARAFDAYKRKDYQSAIALYQKALEAAPSADILYNIARIYDMGLRDRALALSFYGRYVDDPGAIPNRIEVANKRIAELRAAELAAVSPAPAQQPASPTAVVAPQPPPVAAAPPPRESSSGLTTTAIVAGSVGLVGIGLGVGFGLAARSDLEESDRYCNGNDCTSQLGVDAAKDANREANIATIGFAAGGSLLALGAVLWFVSSSSSEHPELAPELTWTPRIGPNELSLAFSGSFGAP